MVKYILCAIYVCFSVSGLTLIKLGSMQPKDRGWIVPIIGIIINKWSFLGILCYGISFCLYLGVVSKFNLGVIIPILGGIVNILIIIIACVFLKESLTLNMVIGAVIISIGIVIMNIGYK